MKSLKLNQIEKNVLSANEMNQVNGGCYVCGCGCNGPSSTYDNKNANAGDGLRSPGELSHDDMHLACDGSCDY